MLNLDADLRVTMNDLGQTVVWSGQTFLGVPILEDQDEFGHRAPVQGAVIGFVAPTSQAGGIHAGNPLTFNGAPYVARNVTRSGDGLVTQVLLMVP